MLHFAHEYHPTPLLAVFRQIAAGSANTRELENAVRSPTFRQIAHEGRAFLTRPGPDNRPMSWNPLAFAAFFAVRSSRHGHGLRMLLGECGDVLSLDEPRGAPAGLTTFGLVACGALVRTGLLQDTFRRSQGTWQTREATPPPHPLRSVDRASLWEAAWATTEILMAGPLGRQEGAALLREAWWRAVLGVDKVVGDQCRPWVAGFASAEWGYEQLTDQAKTFSPNWLETCPEAGAARGARALSRDLPQAASNPAPKTRVRL